MKKIYLFIFLLICTLIRSQSTTTTTASGSITTSGSLTANSNIKNHDRYYNSWRFGINLGATWETSDVRSTPGFAGGFTLEKGFCENKTNFLSWALKGRALWGTAYGLDYTRNYDVKFNPAYNGTYNKAINYDSTSDYVYNNYRTQIAEGALEFQINFNSLRERTNILLNLWGGIGYTSFRVKTNLLDASNKMYNYYAVDSTGGAANIISSHKFLLDNSYESNARNSQNGNILTISPSCGIGLGYRFNDYVSLLWEYKLTFPQGIYADFMDGIKASNNDPIGCVKDYYHYTCINFLFKIGGGHHHKTESTTNVNNYNQANTNTVVANNNVPTNTVSTVTGPVVQKPIVNITNPPYSPYNETANQSFTVNAKLYNVSHRNEVNITFNNEVVTNYSWLGKFVSFVVPLNVGNNVVNIIATNSAGSDSKSATINYNGIPPQITITTPGSNQHVTTQSIQDLNATVLNVSSASDISVKFNNANFNSFGFNPADHSLYMQLPLAKGTNTVDITAVNLFGNDFKSQTIIYNQTNTVVTTTANQRQVTVTITDPNINPYKSQQPNCKVKAKVTGVSAANQVTVTTNSTPITFNYLNGLVDFDVNLGAGNTLVTVSASNGRFSDSKSTVLIFEKLIGTDIGLDPDITICHQRNGIKQTLVIKQSEWAGHQQHGDVMGPCPKVEVTDVDPDITICHNNSNGSKQTIVIKQSAWPQHQTHGDVMGVCPKIIDPGTGTDPDPKIIICHIPPGNPNDPQTITIPLSAWPAHQAHGDTKGSCLKIVDPGDADLDPDITICHKNGDGTETKMTIKQSQWAAHQAHGDYIGGNCSTQTSTVVTNLLQICHKSATGATTTMTIAASAWPIHQAHGDVLGVCVNETGNNSSAQTNTIVICHKKADDSYETITISSTAWNMHKAHGDLLGACAANANNKITICHIPPGNNSNPQTIEINEAAWPAHEAHGDTKGACTLQKTLNPEGEGESKQPKQEGEIKNPGRTNQSQTQPDKIAEPQKTEEGNTLKPR